jgi:hypothetical protein
MMHRLLAMLLVPFFVLGNPFAYAHCAATHSSPSPGRAHIHIGSSSQHGHDHRGHQHHESHAHTHDGTGHEHASHNSQEPVSKPPVDHDSDAVYVAAVDLWFSLTIHRSHNLGSQTSLAGDEHYLPTIRPLVWGDLQRNSLGCVTRLYLLHAALRL